MERVQKCVRSSSRWVPLVEGVQVETVMVIGFAQRDGESPVQVVVIVEE